MADPAWLGVVSVSVSDSATQQTGPLGSFLAQLEPKLHQVLKWFTCFQVDVGIRSDGALAVCVHSLAPPPLPIIGVGLPGDKVQLLQLTFLTDTEPTTEHCWSQLLTTPTIITGQGTEQLPPVSAAEDQQQQRIQSGPQLRDIHKAAAVSVVLLTHYILQHRGQEEEEGAGRLSPLSPAARSGLLQACRCAQSSRVIWHLCSLHRPSRGQLMAYEGSLLPLQLWLLVAAPPFSQHTAVRARQHGTELCSLIALLHRTQLLEVGASDEAAVLNAVGKLRQALAARYASQQQQQQQTPQTWARSWLQEWGFDLQQLLTVAADTSIQHNINFCSICGAGSGDGCAAGVLLHCRQCSHAYHVGCVLSDPLFQPLCSQLSTAGAGVGSGLCLGCQGFPTSRMFWQIPPGFTAGQLNPPAAQGVEQQQQQQQGPAAVAVARTPTAACAGGDGRSSTGGQPAVAVVFQLPSPHPPAGSPATHGDVGGTKPSANDADGASSHMEDQLVQLSPLQEGSSITKAAVEQPQLHRPYPEHQERYTSSVGHHTSQSNVEAPSPRSFKQKQVDVVPLRASSSTAGCEGDHAAAGSPRVAVAAGRQAAEEAADVALPGLAALGLSGSTPKQLQANSPQPHQQFKPADEAAGVESGHAAAAAAVSSPSSVAQPETPSPAAAGCAAAAAAVAPRQSVHVSGPEGPSTSSAASGAASLTPEPTAAAAAAVATSLAAAAAPGMLCVPAAAAPADAAGPAAPDSAASSQQPQACQCHTQEVLEAAAVLEPADPAREVDAAPAAIQPDSSEATCNNRPPVKRACLSRPGSQPVVPLKHVTCQEQQEQLPFAEQLDILTRQQRWLLSADGIDLCIFDSQASPDQQQLSPPLQAQHRQVQLVYPTADTNSQPTLQQRQLQPAGLLHLDQQWQQQPPPYMQQEQASTGFQHLQQQQQLPQLPSYMQQQQVAPAWPQHTQQQQQQEACAGPEHMQQDQQLAYPLWHNHHQQQVAIHASVEQPLQPPLLHQPPLPANGNGGLQCCALEQSGWTLQQQQQQHQQQQLTSASEELGAAVDPVLLCQQHIHQQCPPPQQQQQEQQPGNCEQLREAQPPPPGHSQQAALQKSQQKLDLEQTSQQMISLMLSGVQGTRCCWPGCQQQLSAAQLMGLDCTDVQLAQHTLSEHLVLVQHNARLIHILRKRVCSCLTEQPFSRLRELLLQRLGADAPPASKLAAAALMVLLIPGGSGAGPSWVFPVAAALLRGDQERVMDAATATAADPLQAPDVPDWLLAGDTLVLLANMLEAQVQLNQVNLSAPDLASTCLLLLKELSHTPVGIPQAGLAMVMVLRQAFRPLLLIATTLLQRLSATSGGTATDASNNSGAPCSAYPGAAAATVGPSVTDAAAATVGPSVTDAAAAAAAAGGGGGVEGALTGPAAAAELAGCAVMTLQPAGQHEPQLAVTPVVQQVFEQAAATLASGAASDADVAECCKCCSNLVKLLLTVQGLDDRLLLIDGPWRQLQEAAGLVPDNYLLCGAGLQMLLDLIHQWVPYIPPDCLLNVCLLPEGLLQRFLRVLITAAKLQLWVHDKRNAQQQQQQQLVHQGSGQIPWPADVNSAQQQQQPGSQSAAAVDAHQERLAAITQVLPMYNVIFGALLDRCTGGEVNHDSLVSLAHQAVSTLQAVLRVLLLPDDQLIQASAALQARFGQGLTGHTHSILADKVQEDVIHLSYPQAEDLLAMLEQVCNQVMP